jgi:hypothetical protein
MDDTPRAHPSDIAHLRQIARAIPEDTPTARLRVLHARYCSPTDPVAGATPMDYRHALLTRIAQLLAASPVMEPAR